MIAALLLLCAQASGSPAAPTSSGSSGSPVPPSSLVYQSSPALAEAPAAPAASGATAVLLTESKSVEVGQPIELVLEVEHPLDAAATVPDETLGLDDSWVVLAREEPRSRPTEAGRARTTLRFAVASLEPGARDLAPLKVDVRSHGESYSIFATPPHVEVASVLGEDDHERPPKGFRIAQDFEPEREAWPWLVGAGLVVAVGAGIWLGRRLSRRAAPRPAEPSALVRLDELERSDLERGEAARDAHFELTRVLRDALDRRAGVQRAALDDDEWLERALADAGLAGELGDERERLGALLVACREVKYGGAPATHWAARERIGGARAILKRLDTAAEAKR